MKKNKSTINKEKGKEKQTKLKRSNKKRIEAILEVRPTKKELSVMGDLDSFLFAHDVIGRLGGVPDWEGTMKDLFKVVTTYPDGAVSMNWYFFKNVKNFENAIWNSELLICI